MIKRFLQHIKRRVLRASPSAPKPSETSVVKQPVAKPSAVAPRQVAAHKPGPHPKAESRAAAPHPAHPTHPSRPAAARGPAPAPRPHKPAAPVLSAAERHQGWSVESFPVEPAEGKTRFHDLGLPSEVMHGIADLGFQYCTPVQAVSIPPALEGKDITGKAQTGTGKTAAFLVTIYTRFLRHPRKKPARHGTPRALILAPTRELAIQIEHDAHALGPYTGLHTLAVYGGMDYGKQQDILKTSSPDILVATPGRLLDFKRSGCLDLSQVEVLVIDEADRMLDMGFIPDVRSIVRATPPRELRQTLLFSATLTDDIMRLAAQWMNDAVRVEITPEKVTVDNIEQIVFTVQAKQRFALLYNLLRRDNLQRVLLFCNRRVETDYVLRKCEQYGINAAMISGAVAQKRRLQVLEGFRDGSIRVMVATDVAGRGLHVDNITHVINYDIPYDVEDYVHRIGRTGRAGAKGVAYTFASEDGAFTLPLIEQYIGRPLDYQNPEPALLELPTASRTLRPATEERSTRSGTNRPRPYQGGSRSYGARRR
jgi:ATP-dependent RNA helicase RhlB